MSNRYNFTLIPNQLLSDPSNQLKVFVQEDFVFKVLYQTLFVVKRML